MAGLKAFERRLEKLEQVYNPAAMPIIFLDYFSDGEVTGCNGIDHYRDPVDDGFRVKREPGESIEAFMDRAGAIAKDFYGPMGRNCLVLCLERSESPVRNPEPHSPAPEAVMPVRADPAPVVHIPLPKEKPKPQVRIATIKETEGQHADRPSWYA